ncbi:hypothetical protein BC830DRAFT_1217951 [Chytriomyces sp. MP71]|nr:hypothetical protein BC830DRAFT_1217951 [Chytriomyces sp. MP71]
MRNPTLFQTVVALVAALCLLNFGVGAESIGSKKLYDPASAPAPASTDTSQIAVGKAEEARLLHSLDEFDDVEEADETESADSLAATLRETAATKANETFLARGVRYLKAIVGWIQNNAGYVLAALGVLTAANFLFLAFAMGYLTKEEHYVVRAIKLAKSDRAKVWRAIMDVQSWPLWRSDARRVSLGDAASDKAVLKDKSTFTVGSTTFHVTELEENELLTFKTHPSYVPPKYAVPMVMPGAPVPENINEIAKKKAAVDLAERKAKGEAIPEPPKHRGSNVHDLPTAPFFLPAGIPWATQAWTFELEETKDGKGTIIYVTYMGSYRSRIWRFFISLFGYHLAVESFLAGLANFLGETTAAPVKPEMGMLPNLDEE